MTLLINHTFVSAKSDGVDTTLIQPSNWNAALTTSMATGKVLGRATAGTGVIEELATTGTGKVVLDTNPNFTGPVGIGMAPTNILDITQSQNAASNAKILNASNGNAAGAQFWAAMTGTGTGAFAQFVADNGTSAFDMTQFGASFTTTGVQRQNGSQLYASGAGGLTISANSQPIYFTGGALGATEFARFASGGSFLLGTTTSGGVGGNAQFAVQTASGYAANFYNSGASPGAVGAVQVRVDDTAATLMTFNYQGNGSGVGNISTNGTNTAYNTSSDRRLKNNIVDAPDAGVIIDALRVRSWDWISNGRHEDFGFVAQEEAEVYLPAVTVGDDNPEEIEKQWGRDDSKLVPLLIKEVQSLRRRLAELEDRLA